MSLVASGGNEEGWVGLIKQDDGRAVAARGVDRG
jgi:hypothetical protein